MRFFNTLSGQIDPFIPLDPQGKEVKFYTCGPTVYDYAHIGNFRTFVFEDLLRRVLEFSGYSVKHVMNITDVDDKTIAGAKREGKLLSEYTEKYTKAFQEDLATLNCLAPSEQPRATHEIDSMIRLIEMLIRNGIAYESEGSVYFRVSKFETYGKLSKKNLDQNIAGASHRVDVDEYDKEEVSDFVLWKKTKEDEPSWDSPWGKGRPGWHLECSAMSMKYLGETFDLHAGGEDLIFPHHENEIAQSEGASGKPFVRYWLHCKHLLVNGEKMSKSKGNFYTLRDLLAKGYDAMAIRYLLLATQYQLSTNFTLDGLKEAGVVIKKLDEAYFACLSRFHFCPDLNVSSSGSPYLEKDLEKFTGHLSDNLNIAAAMATLFDTVSNINADLKQMNHDDLSRALNFFTQIDRLLGLKVTTTKEIPADIKTQVELLQKARKEKDFTLSDRIRSEIKASGWLVKDGRPGEASTVKKMQRAWDQ